MGAVGWIIGGWLDASNQEFVSSRAVHACNACVRARAGMRSGCEVGMRLKCDPGASPFSFVKWRFSHFHQAAWWRPVML